MEMLRAELEKIKAEVRTVDSESPFSGFYCIRGRGVVAEGVVIYVERNLGHVLSVCKSCT